MVADVKCAHCRSAPATVAVGAPLDGEVVLVVMCGGCSNVARTAAPGLVVRQLPTRRARRVRTG